MRSRGFWLCATTAIVLVALSYSSTAAAKAPDCSTPRRAVATWLDNLEPGQEPGASTACFDWASAGTPAADRYRLVQELKKVLDGRGLSIDRDALSDDPAFAEREVVPLAGTLDVLVLKKVGSRWMVSADTISATPQLYTDTVAVEVEGLLDDLPPALQFLRGTVAGFAYWQLLGFLLLIIAGLILRSVVIYGVTSQVGRLLDRFDFRAGGTLIRKAAKPAGTLIMGAAVWYLLPVLQLPSFVNKVLIVALRVLIASAAVFVVYRVVDVVADIFQRRAEQTETKLDDQLVPLVRKSVKVFVAAIGVIFVLQNLDVDVGSLIAGASLGGLAFTLAARDTVANLFGSVSIFADRPFQIGDWVVIAGDTEGVVEEVGMRTTRVRTFYDSLVTVPNARVADSVVDNYGARTYKRCFTTLGVTYDTSPEQIQAFCEGIRAVLQANPKVRKDFYEIHFSGFGDFSLSIMVYFFFEVETWTEELTERHNIYLEILRLARELDVSFAFPTQTLHVASAASPKPTPEPVQRSPKELRAAVESFGPEGSKSMPAGPKISHGYLPKAAASGETEAAEG